MGHTNVNILLYFFSIFGNIIKGYFVDRPLIPFLN